MPGHVGSAAHALLCSRPDARLLGWVCTRKDSYVIQYASAQALADPKKAAAIQDFLQRLARSTVWVGAHPNEWATLSAKLVRVDTGDGRYRPARQIALRP